MKPQLSDQIHATLLVYLSVYHTVCVVATSFASIATVTLAFAAHLVFIYILKDEFIFFVRYNMTLGEERMTKRQMKH